MGQEPRAGEHRIREVAKPTDLVAVNGVAAAAIADAPFDAADIPERRVSYAMLIDAGVDPAIADRLRHAYSLVWSFVWRPGSDLKRRAAVVDGLLDEQKDWIAASAPDASADTEPLTLPTQPATPDTTTENPEASDPPSTAGAIEEECPRCGSALVLYALGGCTQTACDACGYVGFETDVAPMPSADSDPE